MYKAIKKAREEQNLSLRQLSEKCGINHGNLNQIEQGNTDARLGTLQKICEALGLEIIIINK